MALVAPGGVAADVAAEDDERAGGHPPGAESGGLFGKGEMGFMGAAAGIGHAVGEPMDGERAIGFEDAAFALDPGGLDGVEPGALDRQIAGDDADAVAVPLDPSVVIPGPGAPMLADVPGRVVPDEGQRLLAGRLELAAAPVQVGGGGGVDRSAVDEPEPHPAGGVLLARVGAPPGAGASQRLRVRLDLRDRLLDQALRSSRQNVAVETWNELGEASGILETVEHGRLYLDHTRPFLDRWRAG
jgi:hypothetical protein